MFNKYCSIFALRMSSNIERGGLHLMILRSTGFNNSPLYKDSDEHFTRLGQVTHCVVVLIDKTSAAPMDPCQHQS